ncbi:MAG: hypothetical protein ACJAQT_004170 [Akkermansiaceae bacterium]|jgi:hypothetical protein
MGLRNEKFQPTASQRKDKAGEGRLNYQKMMSGALLIRKHLQMLFF